MNRFRARALCAAFALLVAGHALAGNTLNVRFHRQNTMVWCWAASIAMVAEYMTGRSIEDCEVLSRYDAALGGRGACCQGDPRCVRGSRPDEIGPILSNIFGLRGSVLQRSLAWSEIVANIDSGRPVIAWVWNSMSSAHVVVISGYDDYGNVIVLDPLRGPLTVPYRGFATNWGPSHNWNISWVFTSSGGGGSASGDDCRTVMRACTHQAHPEGHWNACVHPMHQADPYPCSHVCGYDYYGRPMPCHPYGDPGPCMHPVHPYGDQYACTHAAHPGGDAERICN